MDILFNVIPTVILGCKSVCTLIKFIGYTRWMGWSLGSTSLFCFHLCLYSYNFIVFYRFRQFNGFSLTLILKMTFAVFSCFMVQRTWSTYFVLFFLFFFLFLWLRYLLFEDDIEFADHCCYMRGWQCCRSEHSCLPGTINMLIFPVHEYYTQFYFKATSFPHTNVLAFPL